MNKYDMKKIKTKRFATERNEKELKKEEEELKNVSIVTDTILSKFV